MSLFSFIKHCTVIASPTAPHSVKEYDLHAFCYSTDTGPLVAEQLSIDFEFTSRVARLLEANEVSTLHFTDIIEDLLVEG